MGSVEPVGSVAEAYESVNVSSPLSTRVNVTSTPAGTKSLLAPLAMSFVFLRRADVTDSPSQPSVIYQAELSPFFTAT